MNSSADLSIDFYFLIKPHLRMSDEDQRDSYIIIQPDIPNAPACDQGNTLCMGHTCGATYVHKHEMIKDRTSCF